MVALVAGGIAWWRPWHSTRAAQAAARAPLAASVPAPQSASAGETADAAATDVAANPTEASDASAAANASGTADTSATASTRAAAGSGEGAPVAAATPAGPVELTPGVGRAQLRLSFSADSRVAVYDYTGKPVFTGNGRANSVKTLSGMAPFRVYLGFASGVQLQVNDRAVAIGPQFVSGDVARFEAGADGVLRRDPRPDARRRACAGLAARLIQELLLSKIIEPLRGVHDVLPTQAPAWQHLERTARDVFAAYGYDEFRVPIIEQTQLFKRSIGDFTDIVEKEMFSFVDQGEDHITLRPEATAGMVRAMISNGLLRENRLKVWCMGPMFRRERPQAGRFRQFHQIDAEAFGFEGPDIDAEMILLSARLLRRLGLTRIKLLVNSLGTPAVRAAYRERLTAYFAAHESELDEDSKRRLRTNPLRILDSKNREMQGLIAGAPALLDELDSGVENALRYALRSPRGRRRRISCRAAPGARAGLLHAHGVRVDHGSAGSPEHGMRRWPLRWAGRPARRRGHGRDRLGDGAGAHRDAAREAGAGDSGAAAARLSGADGRAQRGGRAQARRAVARCAAATCACR